MTNADLPSKQRREAVKWLLILFVFVLVSLPGLAFAQYRWVDDQGNVHYSETLSGVPEPYRSKAASPGAASPLNQAHPSQRQLERKPGKTPDAEATLPPGVEVTEAEVADSLRRVRELAAQTKRAEAMCLDIAVNGPGEADVAQAWQQAGQASRQAVQAERQVQRKISGAQEALTDLRRARGLVDVLSSAVEAKRSVRETREAGAAADEAAAGAREAIAEARSTEHDFDLKTSGGAAMCAARLGEQRQSLERLLQLASTNPDAFKAMVGKAKAEYQAMVKREQEEFQASVKRDLGALLQRGQAAAVKLDAQTSPEEVAGAVDALRQQLSAFKIRYGLASKPQQHTDLLNHPVLQAGDALVGTFDAWKREREAAAEIARVQVQLDRRQASNSMMDRAAAVELRNDLHNARREQTEAKTQRSAQWELAKRFLDEANKIAQASGQQPAAPGK